LRTGYKSREIPPPEDWRISCAWGPCYPPDNNTDPATRGRLALSPAELGRPDCSDPRRDIAIATAAEAAANRRFLEIAVAAAVGR